ncbi:MAG TPA: sigma-54 dependent transcriptional regulator, partial [Draconibacterium sp.]|nr:sigma-54 dependent transcriptional regulator [Draconibacterium sp.]
YINNLLVNYLNQHDYLADGAITGHGGMKKLDSSSYDLVLCDFRLPDNDGLQILKHSKSKKNNLPIIIMTAYADVKMAVKLIKAGAFDYVTKPIQPEEILELIDRAIKSENKNEDSQSFHENFIVGTCSTMQDIMQQIDIVAPTELTVIIEGETGAGKEYIAKAIHYASHRSNKPFVAVDCGAIPRELANSELFGHVKGAFTGAVNDKKGVFEQAKGGTLFLDEVGNLPYENQVKLLRALQERVISRVGANKSIKVDVRLIAATNEDLTQKVVENEFREDLFHRLNEFRIQLPPLRQRGEDLFEFVDFFIRKANQTFNKQVQGIDDDVKKLFENYNWWGNIRELQNIINRSVLLCKADYIKPEVLPDEIRLNNLFVNSKNKQSALSGTQNIDLKELSHITEKEMINEALAKTNFNKTKAAKLLNIDRKTLYNKIKLYDIDLIK